jgi:hypothetical protein
MYACSRVYMARYATLSLGRTVFSLLLFLLFHHFAFHLFVYPHPTQCIIGLCNPVLVAIMAMHLISLIIRPGSITIPPEGRPFTHMPSTCILLFNSIHHIGYDDLLERANTIRI